MSGSLASFLRQACDAVYKNSAGRPLTVVLGNTSADLDSFISAVVFAHFHSKKVTQEQRIYVPVLNLTEISSSELWRLRPEFGTALRLAVYGQEKFDGQAKQEKEKGLLACLLTVGDIRSTLGARLWPAFAADSDQDIQERNTQDMILVDHNAPQIPGLSSDDISSRFNVIGVIDHHVEEKTVNALASPRIVKTGIGSCCSLVVQHLRDENLYPRLTDDHDVQVSKLALAPILIDTANLTATGDKISDIDREAVRFLGSHVVASDPFFDRNDFYNEIQESKSNSLNLLTMPEIFERDYKEWTETPANTDKPMKIGIASLVRDIPWLIKHATSTSKLVDAMNNFARKTSHKLSILTLITKGEAPNGKFRKELVIVAYGDLASETLKIFEEDAGELQLQEWTEDQDFSKALKDIGKDNEHVKTASRVWWQGNVSRSRKQVAPLLREAAKKA